MTMNQVAVIETDAVVATMSRARAALAEAKTIQQTKRIVDAAAAAEIYARRQKLGEEASDLALSIKVEALRKLGEMLEALPRNTGAKGIGTSAVPKENRTQTLADLGLTKKESAVAQKLAAMPEKEFQQVRDGHVTVAKAIAAVDTVRTPSAPTKAAPDPEDDDGPSAADLLDDMQKELARAEARVAELEKLMQADGKEAAASLARRLEHAMRQQESLQDDAARLQRNVDRLQRDLRACGRAVGESDLDKIVRAVQAFARAHKQEAA